MFTFDLQLFAHKKGVSSLVAITVKLAYTL